MLAVETTRTRTHEAMDTNQLTAVEVPRGTQARDG